MQLTKRAFLLSGAALAVSAARGAFAMGTPSGFAVVGFAKQGDLGEVIVNPYKISPLTAVIKNGGYELLTAHVRVVPKDGGQEIAYDVSKAQLLTHAGIPVFGLYADYSNKVEVKYSYRFDGKEVKGEHTYTIYCCPLREREPILRLPKSALVTVYPLPNARLLMVVNIHAVNFSLGVDVYSKQLLPIGDQIAHHSGPVIMAGDFNAWSRPRMNALYRFAREMSLREVRFSDDQRRRAFGRPLDFVFYRGLSVHDASVLVTRASDHNPLLVEFSPGKPD